jgi:hypothetical protein
MIILGKVRPLSRHLIEAHPQVSIIAHDVPRGATGKIDNHRLRDMLTKAN